MLSKTKSAFGGKKKIILFVATIAVVLTASRFMVGPTLADNGDEPSVPVCGEEHTDGLISYWKAEGDATDSYDGNNGTPLNGATFDPSGVVDQAFSFDGGDDYVEIPHAANLNTVNEITVEAWVNPGDVTQFSSRTDIVHKNYEFLLGFGISGFGSSNGVHFNVYQGGDHPSGTPYSFVNGEWYHLAGTFDGSQVKIYVNGELENTENWVGTINPTTSTIKISENGWYSNTFDGLVDEVAIYETALTADEVYQHYVNGDAGEQYCTQSKVDFLRDSGVPGKGLENASGLQKPFNYKSQAEQNAGKKE